MADDAACADLMRSGCLPPPRRIAEESLDGRAGMHERARRHDLSRDLIRLWVQRLEAADLSDDLAEIARIAAAIADERT